MSDQIFCNSECTSPPSSLSRFILWLPRTDQPSSFGLLASDPTIDVPTNNEPARKPRWRKPRRMLKDSRSENGNRTNGWVVQRNAAVVEST